jgi:hypothetical protein
MRRISSFVLDPGAANVFAVCRKSWNRSPLDTRRLRRPVPLPIEVRPARRHPGRPHEHATPWSPLRMLVQMPLKLINQLARKRHRPLPRP